MTEPELSGLGHKGDPILKIVRAKCTDCSGGDASEVRKCTATACGLWPYRMGTSPFRKRLMTEDQRKAAGDRLRAIRPQTALKAA